MILFLYVTFENVNYDELHPSSKMDYLVPRDDESIRKGHKSDMPISFLTVRLTCGFIFYS